MKHLKFLFTPVFMGVLFIFLVVAMAVATFLENGFGRESAYLTVYNTKWFELIFILLVVNLIGQLILFRLYSRKSLPVFIFHLSFVLIIIGAGITRYFGWEGTIHIREGEQQDICYSDEQQIRYTVRKNELILADHAEKFRIYSGSDDDYRHTIAIEDKEYELTLAKVIPNAVEVISDDADGVPVVSLLLMRGMQGMENVTLKDGDSKNSNGISFGLNSREEVDVNITCRSDTFSIHSPHQLGEMNMMTQVSNLFEPGEEIILKEMQVITMGDINIIPEKMSVSGVLKPVTANPVEHITGQDVLVFNLSGHNEQDTVYLWKKEAELTASGMVVLNGFGFEIMYGSEIVRLPFSLRLNDFTLERYPGSTSPSGYKSKVLLVDPAEETEEYFTVFMNNVLKHKGYRFYQSSYDEDEEGTILAVNHDVAGMTVTYSGYTLLFLFIILSVISRNSVFHKVNAGFWRSAIRRSTVMIFLIIVAGSLSGLRAQELIVDKVVSEEFGKVLVQDQKGRTKPLYALSDDILRKVSRGNRFDGLTPMQVFLGIYFDFDRWQDVPFIKVSDRNLRARLGIRGDYASFSDFVNVSGDGSYVIYEEVNNAYSKRPGQRSKYDKEVMKVDERINIVYMIYTGDFLKLFPLKDMSNNWGSPDEAVQKAETREDSLYLRSIVNVFTDAILSGDISTIKQINQSIGDYQTNYSGYNLPSPARIKAEILYYRLSVFERLFPCYAAIGIILLISLVARVIRGSNGKSVYIKILGGLLFTGFLFHSFGLMLRWFIAGHIPLSNGYESMIFVSWVTILAGFIFSHKSAFTLSATAVLSSMTLLVAHLSFMDPEITNLVPVLKSYWLTFHVSVITGSYGFLGLGAVLGLINMVMIALLDSRNKERIAATVDNLTVINYKSLTLGLYLLTMGTFLGAVWANESWGRYWGWDPKETWSLISIIIYAFVIHSRMIPGLKDIFTFNLLTFFSFSTVLMTYFGVNYYLTGLHSYAGGDPVPISPFVWITVIIFVSLAFFSYSRYKRQSKTAKIT